MRITSNREKRNAASRIQESGKLFQVRRQLCIVQLKNSKDFQQNPSTIVAVSRRSVMFFKTQLKASTISHYFLSTKFHRMKVSTIHRKTLSEFKKI